MESGSYDVVVVANRLPVDRVVTRGPDGERTVEWRRSPGGLVTALEPVMRRQQGAWVGWTGDAADPEANGSEPEAGPDARGGDGEPHDPGDDGTPRPFDSDGVHLVPVPLSSQEVADYYEGFSNATLWPLYHDVIAPPEFHRSWWDAYVAVNRRFADAAAEVAAEGGTVWVQDYQLQLVPRMLRDRRPDLRIGFFNHIPFPGIEIFSQLPWRRQVLDGLLGADLLGFQRQGDATNFLRACRRAAGLTTKGALVTGPDGRRVRAAPFPISIDAQALDELARTDDVRKRAQEIRHELGGPRVVLLGVDRLDYTKGIRHRLKAYGELLQEGVLAPPDAVLVQVATPSRERVEQYQVLRDQVEVTVGRINGDYSEIGHPAVHYLHHSYDRAEMAAMFLAADVMLVTALRDGMNLVAKEYVASRWDERGVLVLSEFAGAADEMAGAALLINPHDIDGTKDAVVRAVRMEPREQRRRMRTLRRRVMDHDVARWAQDYLDALAVAPGRP